jgi:nucleotide-binding universal stress UspA family protein
MSGLLIIGYDGSEEAGHAIAAAASIVRATNAVVANVWRPAVMATSAYPHAAPAGPPSEYEDAALETAARRIADEGVRRASDAGLRARPELRCGAAADVGDVLDALAEEYDADLIVIGRRDSSWLETALFGSTSKDAVRQSRRPVLVVPYRRD